MFSVQNFEIGEKKKVTLAYQVNKVDGLKI